MKEIVGTCIACTEGCLRFAVPVEVGLAVASKSLALLVCRWSGLPIYLD